MTMTSIKSPITEVEYPVTGWVVVLVPFALFAELMFITAALVREKFTAEFKEESDHD